MLYKSIDLFQYTMIFYWKNISEEILIATTVLIAELYLTYMTQIALTKVTN